MQVTVFKCETTGELFEDEAQYKSHRRALLQRERAAEARQKARATQAALAQKGAQVKTVEELISLVNEISVLDKDVGAESAGTEYRLDAASTVGLNSTSMQLRVLVLRRASQTFGNTRALDMIPGVKAGNGSGTRPPDDAGKGKAAMNYSVTLEFDKLPGLKATRDAILAARQDEQAHLQALRVEAEEVLFSESATYRDLQEEAAQAETAVEELNQKLKTAQAQKANVSAKIRDAVQVQYQELLAVRQEPIQRRASLESLMKVGSV